MENVKPRYKDFDALMQECYLKDKNHAKFKWQVTPSDESQMLFADWDYISPDSIKSELKPLMMSIPDLREREHRRSSLKESANGRISGRG